MKKIFTYFISGISALAAVSSCGLLEPESPSTFDGATVFANYDLAEKSVFGITETFCEVNSYRGRFLPWYGFNTDIEWYNTYKPGDGKTDMAIYDAATNNAQMNTASNGATNNPWALMYAGIERANLTIEGIREYGNVSENKDMAYLLGEALTLRAMIYYDLIKAWGDVPARFEPVSSATIYLPKSDRDIIFKQILKDLEESFAYLPYPGKSAQTSRTDRINQAFAKGLYARIALAAAGYALRPDDGKVGTGDPGTIRLSNDAELKADVLYPKALKYLEEVIASGSCNLEADYEQMWRNLNNMQNLSAGPAFETLYVIPFGEGRGRWNFTFAISSEGASISSGVSRGGDVGPTPTFFFDFADGDIRRDLTCVNYKWTKDNTIEPAGISKWYFGKFRYEWMEAQPYTGGNDDGIKPVVMRYADILLMASEIANELGDLAKAKEYFAPVHDRACGAGSTDTYLASVDQTSMLEKIQDERAFEFCGEFLRKGDLIRWGILKQKMDEATAKMAKLRGLEAPYDFMNGNIWYKLSDDEKSLDIYGLKLGETGTPDGEWESKEDYVTTYVKDTLKVWTTYQQALVKAKSEADSTKAKTSYEKSRTTIMAEGLGDERISSGMYVNDPESCMYWPIFDCNKTDSQGVLVNDYIYK